MGYIKIPDIDNVYIPQILDTDVQDAGKWMSMFEYDYIVEMILGKTMDGAKNIDNYIQREFRKPIALFFTTNVDKTENANGWRHLMVLEAMMKDEGLYIDSFYRVGFLTKELPRGKEFKTIGEAMKKFDAKYYYGLKDAVYIKSGWLGYVNNYKGLLDRLDEWWVTFGGGV
tara:strand:- start:72 stop:584 length:513 start_codon:yes stop_codon:yes gene_type:complete